MFGTAKDGGGNGGANFGGLEADFYSSDITDSPLMADDSSTGLFVGVMRRF